jgi:DNA-binding NtrC family response regulator
MPLALQTKLLRVLQERRVRRVGGLDDVEVDVRVVAATNRDLRSEVRAGRFRADLYYRLRVVPLEVPPLRERRDDILPLAEHMLARLAPELGRPAMVLADEARAAMRAYDWPGNVRELANAVERAVISAVEDVVQVADLVMDEELIAVATDETPDLPPGTLVLPPGERNLAEIERLVVAAALDEAGGQKSKAAAMLGINRTTLYNKLKDEGGD